MTPQITAQKSTPGLATPSLKELRYWGAYTLQQQRITRGELCLQIVDTADSRRLNRRYRHKNRSTNVLAFPAGLSRVPGAPILLGDLVLCADVINREAVEQGKSRRAHWCHMIVHGTLHLLGFDHLRKTDAQKMEAREIKILQKLGFDNPYNDSP